jgi:hypothetical protein
MIGRFLIQLGCLVGLAAAGLSAAGCGASDGANADAAEEGVEAIEQELTVARRPPPPPPVEHIFCGGIAAIRCPGRGDCVDDPSDDCDPKAAGADCGGICQCGFGVACNPDRYFDASPGVCACVPTVDPPSCALPAADAL